MVSSYEVVKRSEGHLMHFDACARISRKVTMVNMNPKDRSQGSFLCHMYFLRTVCSGSLSVGGGSTEAARATELSLSRQLSVPVNSTQCAVSVWRSGKCAVNDMSSLLKFLGAIFAK